MNLEKKVIVVTGASSGIGLAIAKELSKDHIVILLARREKVLKEIVNEMILEKREVSYQVTDVTKIEELERAINFVLDRYGQIDVLINNAGIMPLSFLSEQKIHEWDQMIDTNVKGVLYGISVVLPIMRKKKSGHIISIASIAGHLVKPSLAVYSATKHAVCAIMEGLRQEEALAKSNIRVTTISPGAIGTNLLSTITSLDLKNSFIEFYKNSIDPERIAKIVAFVINQPIDTAINEIIIRPTLQEP